MGDAPLLQRNRRAVTAMIMRPTLQRKQSGFSLIELMVVLAIMAVLSLMAAPVVSMQVKRQKEQELKMALQEIRQGIDAYKKASDQGLVMPTPNGYPASLTELMDGVTNVKLPVETKIYFLRRIPRDPFYAGPTATPAAETWGLRAYSSSPANPQAGSDVYDVYSLSTGKGLNGVPYGQW